MLPNPPGVGKRARRSRLAVAGRRRGSCRLHAVQYRHLGRSGLAVSEIGLGTWLTLGSSVDAAGTREIVHRAYDLGVNLFDTADVYSDGDCELALGRAIAELPRRHLVIATKAFFPASARPNDGGLSRKHLFESVETSLRRLGTDYLDLHQAHRFDPETPLEETLRAYEDLIRQGKVLYWGVSLWTTEQVEAACTMATDRGGLAPVSEQSLYSIVRRDVEAEHLGACEAAGLSQLIFSPLAQGVLSGKYGGGARPADARAADPQRSAFMNAYLDDALLARVDALRPIAADLGLTMSQLALAWCLRKTAIASTLVGVTRLAQLEDNVGASGVALPAEAVKRIDEILPGPAS